MCAILQTRVAYVIHGKAHDCPSLPSQQYEIDESGANLDDILGMVKQEGYVSGGKASFTLRDKIEAFAVCRQLSRMQRHLFKRMEAARVLKERTAGCDEFSLAVYPSSQPVFADLVKKGLCPTWMDAG